MGSGMTSNYLEGVKNGKIARLPLGLESLRFDVADQSGLFPVDCLASGNGTNRKVDVLMEYKCD